MNYTIFEFSKDSDISFWRIVDDIVMGGVSQGNFKLNQNGKGEYSGKVSLENNGGFSMLRYRFLEMNVLKYSKVILRLKGDGKKYQFRIKDNHKNYYTYVKSFNTSKDWELIKINLADMYPAFRGKKLDMSNFSSDVIEEVAILVGNKKEEIFQLEIDEIYLE